MHTRQEEEVNTLMILYGIEVAGFNSFQEIGFVVLSRAPDVLLLLLFCYRSLFSAQRAGHNVHDNVGLAHEMLAEDQTANLYG